MSPKQEAELLERIAGGEGIKEVCAAQGMPHESTVYRRMAADADFASRIARAREAQQDAEADKIVDLADAATAEDWQVVKLRIWARQWRAAKLAPKKYGEKVALEHEAGSTLEALILQAGRLKAERDGPS